MSVSSAAIGATGFDSWPVALLASHTNSHFELRGGRRCKREVQARLACYLWTNVNMFVIGVLSGLGDLVLGVPYAVLLGILAGLSEILPYIGPWLGGSAAVLVALFAGGIVNATEVAAWYVVLQLVEGHTLVPVVMYRAVRVNPLTVIVAVLVGGTLYGIIGGVLAVPVAAVLQVLMVRVLAPAARSAAARHAARRQVNAESQSEPEAPGIVAPVA
jgi:predicted PurR-regulated permease PerM